MAGFHSVPREMLALSSAEAARHEMRGPRIGWRCKKFSASIELNKFAQIHETCIIRDPRRLLKVVRHDNDRVIGLQFEDRLFDFRR